MSSPILRARRMALSLLLAALLALLVPGLQARADPTPTQIQASVAADTAGHVKVTGVLRDGSGLGLGGGQLTASVAGQPLQTVASGGDGAFAMEFNIPADKLTGPQDLVISYPGDAQHAPSSQTSRIEFSAQGTTTVTLEVEPASTTPGDLVRVVGSVKTVSGEAVAGGLVTFAYEGAALSDYTLVTDASGNFDSYVEIPGTAAVGTGKLVATFTGGANLQSGSAEKEITVNAPIVESSPTATASEATEGAAPQIPSQTASTRPAATTSPSGTAAQGEGRGGSLLWWLVGGGVVLIAAAALAVLGLIVRSRRRDADEETSGLIGDGELLEDEPDEMGYDPAPGSDDETEVRAETEFMAPQGVTEVFAPRREPETQTMQPAWFREGEDVPPPSPRAPGEDWDDFTDVEITQVRVRDQEPPQDPQPRRGGDPRPRRGI